MRSSAAAAGQICVLQMLQQKYRLCAKDLAYQRFFSARIAQLHGHIAVLEYFHTEFGITWIALARIHEYVRYGDTIARHHLETLKDLLSTVPHVYEFLVSKLVPEEVRKNL